MSAIDACKWFPDEAVERLFLTSVYVCCSLLISLDSVCFLFQPFYMSFFLFCYSNLYISATCGFFILTLLSEGQTDSCEKEVHFNIILKEVLFKEIMHLKSVNLMSCFWTLNGVLIATKLTCIIVKKLY